VARCFKLPSNQWCVLRSYLKSYKTPDHINGDGFQRLKLLKSQVPDRMQSNFRRLTICSNLAIFSND